MAKVVVRLPEPKEEYDFSNQKQINRAIALIVEQLNSTFLNDQKQEQANLSESSFNCVKNVEFNCSIIEVKDLLICLWLSSLYSFLGSGNLTTTLVIIFSHLLEHLL